MIRPDTDDLIAFLNSLVAIDAAAIHTLVEARVTCNTKLADHRSVQAVQVDVGVYNVGLLGILNGYCGTVDAGKHVGWGPITAVYVHGRLVRFERTEKDEWRLGMDV